MKSNSLDSAVDTTESAQATLGGVYRDLLEWSLPFPLWQQELLRRVLHQKQLTSEDVSELAAAAVAETEQQASQYRPLAIADVPSIASAGVPVHLAAIRNVANVNALRSDQNLTFGQHLTVVYGDNASGKSGYGRVLKQVYRARVVDDILGDVRLEEVPSGVARATFVTRSADGLENVVDWINGTPVSNIGRFAVLDGACSLTYVRGGALAAGPLGIDVPQRFATELDRVKRTLVAQATATQPDKKSLQALESDTEAGRFVRTLSSATTPESIGAATAWTPEHELELGTLKDEIAKSDLQTLSARRSALQTRARALDSLRVRLEGWTRACAQENVNALRSASGSVADADSAMSALQFLNCDEVPAHRLAGSIWTELLGAASRYVTSIGSSGTTGSFSADGRCVLCWQELDSDARVRLQSFQDHLTGTAQKARAAAISRRDELVSIVLTIPEEVPSEAEALVASVHDLPRQLRDLVALLKARRDEIMASLTSGEWQAFVPLSEGVLASIRTLHSAALAELSALPATDAEGELGRAKLAKRHTELQSRSALSRSESLVREFIRKTVEHQRLTAAQNAINTRLASNKASELHTKHMTERYAALVDAELGELRFRRLKPILVQKTNKAKVEVTPLVSAELKHIAAEKVFSEGERTAIALACFLAEVRLSNDPSGLIFDDPISSLDHGVREHVARRLVAAAKERQVIVFTHDLAFLADLREQAQKIQSVGCEFRTLASLGVQTGLVENDEPFGARGIGKRTRALKESLVAIERAAKDGNLEQYRSLGRDFYERLRSTWERFIEERLFAKVVQRLERNVTPGALAKVPFSKELAEKVHEGWRRCSTAIEAHDHAPATGGQSYTIEEIKADFQTLLDVEKSTPST